MVLEKQSKTHTFQNYILKITEFIGETELGQLNLRFRSTMYRNTKRNIDTFRDNFDSWKGTSGDAGGSLWGGECWLLGTGNADEHESEIVWWHLTWAQ